MKISQIGEFGLIERIKKRINNPSIGSDTAPVRLTGKTYLLTCDVLLEDRHFLKTYPPDAVGYKAIAVNVSDIVASGGKPKFALVSLLLPDLPVSYVDGLYQGIVAACRMYRLKVIGGNVAKSKKIGVDVFMVGEAKKFVGRNVLRPGQSIYVSGTLGDSHAGRELLAKKKSRLDGFEKILVERHLKPVINVKVADYVGRNAAASLDVSDGLSGDLQHLKGKSKVKINIDSSTIPVSQELLQFCKKYRYDAVKYALTGGEDYRVLFSQKLKLSRFKKIGRVEKGDGIYLDGRPLRGQGFDHFK